jgi:NAD-dependent SIR2 family protein deacetylase
VQIRSPTGYPIGFPTDIDRLLTRKRVRDGEMTSLRKVVFLGAGASKPFGFPLTAEIFPWILDRIEDGKLFKHESGLRSELKDLLTALLPGKHLWRAHLTSDDWKQRFPWIAEDAAPEFRDAEHRKSLPWITDVLSLLDHLAIYSNALSPKLGPLELVRARSLLERGIFESLERTYSNPDFDLPETIKKEWASVSANTVRLSQCAYTDAHLTKMVDWLEYERSRSENLTVISTNYDIAVETELYVRLRSRIEVSDFYRSVDFGVCVREPRGGTVFSQPEHAGLGIYKLHGSLNWLRCDLCDHIYVNPLGAIAYLAFVNDVGDAKKCHCGYEPLRPVIVAPSLVRDVRDANLLQVWRSALETMRRADEWIIIGYSMPAEDIAIRSLFLRAYHGRHTPPKVTVVQRGCDPKTFTSYGLLFSGMDPSRDYRQGGLEKYLETVSQSRPA